MERLLLLLPTTTYRTEDFLDAARTLGVDVVCASEKPSTFETHAPDHLLTIDFADPDAAAATVAALAARRPLNAVVGVDDLTTVAAAAIAERLGLRSNAVAAVAAARDKYQMRQCLAAAGVPVPRFRRIALKDDPFLAARGVAFPCVLKPLALSASRGVIRANNVDQFIAAFRRIAALLQRGDVAAGGDAAQFLLAEQYIPGVEVALEGLLMSGRLHTLALFDKPDPLEGPFFEETLYVTPSREPALVQDAIATAVASGATALGLRHGPLHAECRVNDAGVHLLEIAARPIGGLCSKALRFVSPGGEASLEEVLLRHALRQDVSAFSRERRASGVMMIPIPHRGVFKSVDGERDARAVPDIVDLNITAKRDAMLIPLPEGRSYLGFIFARATTPLAVEQALRAAHAKLHFRIDREIALV
jgi:ATP-grasp domain-containing protein/L-aminoacid ligase-like protein